jgi:hypothetical protein
LFFHVGGGAVVVSPVQNWRPFDKENDGKGTLIEYPLVRIRAERWCCARRDVGIDTEVDDAEENAEIDESDDDETLRGNSVPEPAPLDADSDAESTESTDAVVVTVSFSSDPPMRGLLVGEKK